MRVAVVGARGQLGAAVVEELAGRHDVTALTRGDVDLTDRRAIAAVMAAARPDAIVNCAAFNDVDGAEDRPVDALDVNAFAVQALAQAAEKHGSALVHFGTDFVFDGAASVPYREDDPPHPRSTYGASKLLGEWFALEASRGYVLRVESLFGSVPSGPPPKGSVASIVRKLREGVEVPVFVDRTISPSFIPDIASAVGALLELGVEPGLYNCVNEGSCTWHEFALELAKRLGVEPKLRAIRMADTPMRAQRPLYCALSVEKLAAAGFAMPHWKDAVARYSHQLSDDLSHPLSNR